MRELVVRIRCDRCETSGSIEAHFENVEVSVGERTLEMDLCTPCAEELFNSYLQFGREMPKTGDGAAQPTEKIKCPHCENSYRGTGGLNKHIKAKHPETTEMEST